MSDSTLFPLPHLALLRAEGPDAQAFLQAQLSCDLREVSAERGQLGGYCSPKGRLLAVLTLLAAGPEAYWLVLPQALAAPTLKRLKMFVLRSRVALTEAADFAVFGHLGDVPSAPTSPWQSAGWAGSNWLRRPGAARHLVVAPRQEDAAPNHAAAAAWRLAELEAGLPVVYPETLDAFVPQTADLDLAGGISFSKGCYPGQEIVARVHYLGRVKQRLFRAFSAGPAQPGAAIVDGQGQTLGTVMEALPHPAGGTQLLAVLPLAAAEPLFLEQGGAVNALARAHPDST